MDTRVRHYVPSLDDEGKWHEPAVGDRGYSYERMLCGHHLAIIEIAITTSWLALVDGCFYGIRQAGLSDVEQELEDWVRRKHRWRGEPWDGATERRNRERERHV